MDRDSSRRVRVAVVLGGAAIPIAIFASCAESSKSGPEAEQQLIDGQAGPDAVPGFGDAGCEAGDPRCAPSARSCGAIGDVLLGEEADFCPVPTGIDPRYALTAVWGTGPNDVWAVGSAGTILHFDGAAWKPTPVSTPQTLYAIGGTGPSDIWVTSTFNVVFHGTGFHDGGAEWTLSPMFTSRDLFGGATSLLRSVWTFGDTVSIGGDALLLRRGLQRHVHWQRSSLDGGTVWTGVSPNCNAPSGGAETCKAISAMWGSSLDDVWVVGHAGWLMHVSGSADGGPPEWTQVETHTLADLRAVWGSSASDVWAVGTSGTVLHSRADNAPWEAASVPSSEDLHGVWGSGPNDVWAVGAFGTILHYDGVAWTKSSVGLPDDEKPDLFGVWGSGPNDVWVVGTNIALHFTGPRGGGEQ